MFEKKRIQTEPQSFRIGKSKKKMFIFAPSISQLMILKTFSGKAEDECVSKRERHIILGYLRDRNAATHSVDGDIF